MNPNQYITDNYNKIFNDASNLSKKYTKFNTAPEDVVSELSIYFNTHIDKFNELYEGGEIQYWIVRFILNKLTFMNSSMNHLNYDRPTNTYSFDTLLVDNDKEESTFLPSVEPDNTFDVMNYLNQLKDRLTEYELSIVNLKLEGYGTKEIGELLGKAQQTITNTYDRAVVKMKVAAGTITPDDTHYIIPKQRNLNNYSKRSAAFNDTEHKVIQSYLDNIPAKKILKEVDGVNTLNDVYRIIQHAKKHYGQF